MQASLAAMSRVPDRLTPRSIALGHLIFLSVTDKDLSYDERIQLFCMLIELVSGSGGATSVLEPSFSELSAQLAALPGASMAVFVERYTKELLEVGEADDVWELISTDLRFA